MQNEKVYHGEMLGAVGFMGIQASSVGCLADRQYENSHIISVTCLTGEGRNDHKEGQTEATTGTDGEVS